MNTFSALTIQRISLLVTRQKQAALKPGLLNPGSVCQAYLTQAFHNKPLVLPNYL